MATYNLVGLNTAGPDLRAPTASDNATVQGNLGIGVTPSAWLSSLKAIQITGVNGVYGAGSSEIGLTQNAYYNASSQWIYGITNSAGAYQISAGVHKWLTAPSGTVGAAITFAQAMTLDASGKLLLGGVSDAALDGVFGAVVGSPSKSNAGIAYETANSLWLTYTDSSAQAYIIYDSRQNLERARIDSYGNLGLGVTPSAWTTYPALQAGRTGLMGAGNETNISVNGYYDGSWKYIASEEASLYNQSGATHSWHNAPSGTAGGAIAFSVVKTIDNSGHWLPGADNTQNIGSGALRMATLYAGTGTINTSDAREKTPVRSLNENELAAARDMAREPGVYQFLSSVAEKGEEGARLHIGMTVQRAIEVMEAHGLDPMRYGFICHDVWDAETREEIAEDGEFSREVTRQVVEVVPVEYQEIEIVDGVPTRVTKTKTEQRHAFDQVGVVDEDGQPIMVEDQPEKLAVTDKDGNIVKPEQPATYKQLTHPVPRMETVEERYNVITVREAGDRYSFREGQLALFILAGLSAS